jgi:hypothetical protein
VGATGKANLGDPVGRDLKFQISDGQCEGTGGCDIFGGAKQSQLYAFLG